MSADRGAGLLLGAALGALAVALVWTLGWSWSGLAVLPLAAACLLWWWRQRAGLERLRRVAQAYAAGELSARARLDGDDALARLGHQLNALGERLEAARGELDSQRRLLDSALAVLAEGVACIDRLDRVVYANAAWRHLAAGGSEVAGRPYYDHLPAGAVAAALAAARAGAAPRESEFEHRRRLLRALAMPAGGELTVVVLHDETEVRRLELARRDFVAAIGHELKTPLTAILGAADTLDGSADDAGQVRSLAATLVRHSERLASLIGDVLTLSRLEGGGWQVRPEACDLAALCRAVADEHRLAAGERQVTIACTGDNPLPVVGDPELLRQLVGNLVSNAVRYNRAGGSATVRASVDADDPETVSIAVADTGIGIPPEHRDRIFERFYRVDAHRSRQSGGTGLGLAIVRQLAEAMGGRVTLESGTAGSTFTVTIPRRDPRAALPAERIGRRL